MTRLADAYDALAEAAAALAIELRATASQDARSGAPAAEPTPDTTAPSFDDLPPEEESWATEAEEAWVKEGRYIPPQKPAGSAAVCPSHGIPYRKGRYGMFCPSLSDEPEWANDKGYCRITPRSAAAWLRQHA